MQKSRKQSGPSLLFNHLLLTFVILLGIIVGILGSILYLQKGMEETEAKNKLAPDESVLFGKTTDKKIKENFNKFLVISATVKKRDSNKIVLVGLPNFTLKDGRGFSDEMTVFVSDLTKIVRTDIKKIKSDEGATTEIPSALEDIKVGTNLTVYFFEAIEMQKNMPEVEAKKIRID